MLQERDTRCVVGGAKRSGQRGFTLAEIMISMIVFMIAMVGLVALENRAIDAQRASMEIREAERIAQRVMSEMQTTGFDGLVVQDFADNLNPEFPYDDENLDTYRLIDYGGVPADRDSGGDDPSVPGIRPQFFWVGRSIERFPTSDPQPGGDPELVDALQLRVDVLWIDFSNPQFPPPIPPRWMTFGPR